LKTLVVFDDLQLNLVGRLGSALQGALTLSEVGENEAAAGEGRSSGLLRNLGPNVHGDELRQQGDSEKLSQSAPLLIEDQCNIG
jgi:hypothetical protein